LIFFEKLKTFIDGGAVRGGSCFALLLGCTVHWAVSCSLGLGPKARQAFDFLKPNPESLALEMGRSLVYHVWSIVFCTAATGANLEKADIEASIDK
jgi:hypothetical protein